VEAANQTSGSELMMRQQIVMMYKGGGSGSIQRQWSKVKAVNQSIGKSKHWQINSIGKSKHWQVNCVVQRALFKG